VPSSKKYLRLLTRACFRRRRVSNHSDDGVGMYLCKPAPAPRSAYAKRSNGLHKTN
jgi:hypothetical protein